MKKTFYLFFALGLFTIQSIFAQINSNSPAVPFNSRSSYPYGIMPTNLPTSGTYTKSQAAADAYNSWKSNLTATCTVGTRVKYDDTSVTVSEGIAYGMLLAAYAGDKPLFDNLWKYYLNNKNTNGVMNWKINGCSGVSGQNGATDAELDAALALIIASEQWPNATSPYTYKNEALYLIGKIRQYEMHPSTYHTLNGDGWGTTNTCRNPSYFSPAYYREYAKVETTQASFWNSATSTANSFLLTNRNSTTGLVSNWADNNATANGCNGANEFGWDAIRNPWRMATDYIWNGSSTATTAADICGKMSAWAKNYASNLKGPCAQNAANPSVGTYKNGTFGMIGLAFMGTSGTTYQEALNTAYTNIVNLGSSESYFSQTLRCMTLFMMTGNFWKPGTVTAAPTFASATTNSTGTTITINFSSAISLGTTTASAFTLKIGGSTVANAITAIALNGTTAIDLTIASGKIAAGNVITLDYTPGSIKGTGTGTPSVAAFNNQSVTNALAGNSTIIFNAETGSLTLLNTSWFSYNDAAAGGSSTVTPLSTTTLGFAMTAGGANSTANAAKISYTLNKGILSYDPFVGMGFAFKDPAGAYDLSGSTGITFYYKSDKAINLEINLTTITDDCNFYASLPISTNWTKKTLAWSDFQQFTWGAQKAWDLTKINKFQWKVQTTTGTSGTIWVDEVQIDGKILDLPTSVTKILSSGANVSIFPNPCESTINILAEKSIAKISILSTVGILQKQVSVNNNTEIQLPVSELSKGIYVLMIKYTDGTTETARILKN